MSNPTAIQELLRNNPYPGRGVLMGLMPDGGTAVLAYFIMGRSANSRNRVFVRNGEGFGIRLFREDPAADTGLTLYRPMHRAGNQLVLSNGDQTDTVAAGLAAGLSLEQALRSRRHEPDAPHFTPRITGLMNLLDGAYTLSILRAADNRGEACDRLFFEYAPSPGQGRLIHTYLGDGSPLPSFEGEPRPVSIPGDLREFARELWASLHPDNRVALYVSGVSLQTGASEALIFNRHQEEEVHA